MPRTRRTRSAEREGPFVMGLDQRPLAGLHEGVAARTNPPGPQARVGRVVGIVAVLMHMLVGAFPYAVSGLVAPLSGVALLWLMWLGLLVLVVWLARAGRPIALAVPVAAVILWFAIISFGGMVLGWTA